MMKVHILENKSHLDFQARCCWPAFLVCVDVFREQATYEVATETKRENI